jgi:hypothetical protein
VPLLTSCRLSRQFPFSRHRDNHRLSYDDGDLLEFALFARSRFALRPKTGPAPAMESGFLLLVPWASVCRRKRYTFTGRLAVD